MNRKEKKNTLTVEQNRINFTKARYQPCDKNVRASKLKCNRFMYLTCNSIEFPGTIRTAIVRIEMRVRT